MADKKIEEPENKKAVVSQEGLEIDTEIREKEQKLFDLKIDLRLGKLKNPNEIKSVRRDIARLKTKKNLNKFISSAKE